jgi:hypothetical protein
VTAKDAGDGGRAGTRRSEFEAAVEEAQRHLLEAREAWHAQRGDIAPPRERMTGLPEGAPQSLKDARRRYEQAREAWLRERDRWLTDPDHGPRPAD